MASIPALGHSEEIMVAQPVDTIPTAPAAVASDIMSPGVGSSKAKETENADMSEASLDLSISPGKDREGGDLSVQGLQDRGRDPFGNDGRMRTSPSPSSRPSSRTRIRSFSKRPISTSLKRSTSTPISLPMMPRRGRTAVSDAEMWGDTGRMVHRKVNHEDGTAEMMVKGVVEQLAADRAAIAALYGAIQTIAGVVNKHDEGLTEMDRRMQEQTRLRLDDHRLHIGAMTHVRAGVEDLETS